LRLVDTIARPGLLPLADSLNRLFSKLEFLSNNIRGLDLQVLRSNDWARYRPAFVLVEALDFKLENAAQQPLHIFMGDIDYELVAKTLNTLFYRDKR
jgi:hypothetical protein